MAAPATKPNEDVKENVSSDGFGDFDEWQEAEEAEPQPKDSDEFSNAFDDAPSALADEEVSKDEVVEEVVAEKP